MPRSRSKKPERARRSPTRGASPKPRVAILMGSASDADVMRPASDTLERLGVESEVLVISAHRTPDRLEAFTETAEARGIEVIICGAGGAAHLAGVTAARTLLPVLGVPIESSPLSGLDALLATVQMPGGIGAVRRRARAPLDVGPPAGRARRHHSFARLCLAARAYGACIPGSRS
jgi:phosphoribosylaminoimidazole carboxylase PurE protein